MIAKVNGEIVLAGELLWRANLRLEEAAGQFPADKRDEIRDELMQQLLKNLLEMRMIYADFRQSIPKEADLSSTYDSLNDAFEKDEIPRLMEETGVKDPQHLPGRLVSLGTSLRERREDYYKTMIAKSWLSEGLKFNREVTHQNMLEYYQEHASNFENPTRARWEELMVRYDTHTSDREAYLAICKMGSQAFQQLRQAKSPSDPVFDAIAKANSQGITASDGGVHDWTTLGALAAEKVDEAIFSLPVGQMSPIIRGPQGFHIVHVLERKQAGCTPFTELQNEIRNKIRDQRFSQAIRAKLADLRSNAHIWTVYDGHIQREEEIAARPGNSPH